MSLSYSSRHDADLEELISPDHPRMRPAFEFVPTSCEWWAASKSVRPSTRCKSDLADFLGSLEFRSEFFNVVNHAQFANPGLAFGTAQFGVISAQANSPRQVQLALKLFFLS